MFCLRCAQSSRSAAYVPTARCNKKVIIPARPRTRFTHTIDTQFVLAHDPHTIRFRTIRFRMPSGRFHTLSGRFRRSSPQFAAVRCHAKFGLSAAPPASSSSPHAVSRAPSVPTSLLKTGVSLAKRIPCIYDFTIGTRRERREDHHPARCKDHRAPRTWGTLHPTRRSSLRTRREGLPRTADYC